MRKIKAYAKINLFLDITGVKPNGRHTLENIMRVIDLYDCIAVSAEDSEETEITVRCNGGIPDGTENTAYKAAEKFLLKTNKTARVSIITEKHIPSKAGLGGGSADAAAVLRELNRLFNLPLNNEELLKLGLEIGDDVPFLLAGELNDTGLYRSENEETVKVEIFPRILPEMKVKIVMPEFGISTAEAFGEYDKRFGKITANPYANTFAEAVRLGKPEFGLIYNVFEKLLSPEQSREIASIKSEFLKNGAIAAGMSGSGSACFGIFLD